MSADLAAFLLARYDDDEKLAREARDENPEATWQPSRHYDGIYALDLHSTHPDSDSYGMGNDLLLPREMARHIARWDPARVLAECEARRRIVEEHRRQWSENAAGGHSPMNGYIGNGRLRGLWTALQYLALPYSSHPDFDPEWRLT